MTMNYANASAIYRVLGFVPVKVEVWANAIWVNPGKGKGRPTFLSKQAIINDFANSRKARADEIKTEVIGERLSVKQFRAFSSSGNGSYIVSVGVRSKLGKVHCTCHDFKLHDQGAFGHSCKHIYSVLRRLGFQSLKDFVASFDPYSD